MNNKINYQANYKLKIITQTKKIKVEVSTVTCELWLSCLTDLKNLGSSFTIKYQSLKNKIDKLVVRENLKTILRLCKRTKKKLRERL